MNELDRFKKKVWPKIERFYSKQGPANYPGYLKGKGWHGPYVWSENGDTVRIITRFCEEEFGIHSVHNESKVDGFRFKNFNPKKDKRKSIDIDITDASICKNSDKFRELEHGLFIEVKHVSKGCIWVDHARKIEGFINDCEKLKEEKGKRVKYCIAILIDDGDGSGDPYLEKYIESKGYKNTKNFKDKIKRKGVNPLILQWKKEKRKYETV